MENAQTQSEFWSKVAAQYDSTVELQIGWGVRPRVRDRLAQESGLGAVAEFGCGTGFYTETLAARADSVIATDLSPGMLALAKERTKAPDVKFQVEDCQRTSFPDAGLTRYRTKPPKGFGRNALSEQRLRELLEKSSFRVLNAETFKDPRRSSSIPVQYVKALKVRTPSASKIRTTPREAFSSF